MENLQGETNHPVHIQNEDGTLSPTALIPFCEFGGNMPIMGVKIDKFDVPVCNSFMPKLLGNQLEAREFYILTSLTRKSWNWKSNETLTKNSQTTCKVSS